MTPSTIEALACARWPGEPVARRGRVLRVGSGAKRGGGSIVVELEGAKAGAWFDHSTGEGGWLTGSSRPEAGGLQETVRRATRDRAGLEVDERSVKLHELVARAEPSRGSVAERYLAARGIEPPEGGWPWCVRWVDRPRALFVVAQDGNGAPTHGQLVHLTADGRKDTTRQAVKRTVVAGANWHRTGAVRLPGLPFRSLLVAEGPETALSLWAATGHPVWAALGPHLGAMPFGARRWVTLCRDADAPLSDADAAAWRQAEQVLARGYRCRVADVRLVGYGPHLDGGGKDFNDLLRARGAEAVRAAVKAAVEVDAERVERRLTRCAAARKEREEAKRRARAQVAQSGGRPSAPGRRLATEQAT